MKRFFIIVIIAIAIVVLTFASKFRVAFAFLLSFFVCTFPHPVQVREKTVLESFVFSYKFE